MELSTFNSMLYNFSLVRKMKHFVAGETVPVTVYRFNSNNSCFGEGIVIFTDKVFYDRRLISRVTGEKEERSMLEKVFQMSEAAFVYEEKSQICFSELELRAKLLSMSVVMKRDSRVMELTKSKLGFEYYKLHFLSKGVSQINIFKYPLNKWEVDELLKEEVMFCESSLAKHTAKDTLMDEGKNVYRHTENLFMFSEKFFSKSFYRETEELPSLKSDFRSSIQNRMKDTLTLKKMSYWCKSRHNIFAEVVIQEMGWPMPEKMDFSPMDTFKYYGVDHYKTPDYIIDMGSYWLMLDFAVTSVDTSPIRAGKIRKYKDLAGGLSRHLGKEVRLDAVVWNINTRDDFSLPTPLRGIRPSMINSVDLEFLYRMHLNISTSSDYEKYRIMSEKEDDSDERVLSFTLDEMQKVTSSGLKLAPNLSSIRSVDIMASRGNPSFEKMETGSRRLEEFKFSKMSDELQKMKNQTLEEYERELLSEASSMLMSKEPILPSHLKEVFEDNYNLVKVKSSKLMEMENQKRIKFQENMNQSTKKFFKFPYVDVSMNHMEVYFKNRNADLFGAQKYTDDGTFYYDSSFDWKQQKERELVKKASLYSVEGMGLDPSVDIPKMEVFLDGLKREKVFKPDSLMDSYKFIDKEESMGNIRQSNLWMLLCWVSDLYMNISYLLGRREVFYTVSYKDGYQKPAKKSMTVLKRFGEYILMIKKGSMLTADKAIRFRVITTVENSENSMFKGAYFQKMESCTFDENLVQSRWLSCTITDIRHFLKIKEVGMALAVNFRDKEMEDKKKRYLGYNCFEKNYLTMMVVLLEKSRNTSTTAQLNRYLLNSSLSYLSNRMEVLKDIHSDTVRSSVCAYIRICQVNWFNKMIDLMEDIWYSKLRDLHSTGPSFDRLHLPSFYDLSRDVEFSVTMDEIYTCNLFDKESGFKDHRFKGIVEKMTSAEMKFNMIKSTEESQGKVSNLQDFWKSKDTLHTFDRKFVTKASRKYFKEKANRVRVQEAVLKAMYSVIDDAMMMTSSVEAGPYLSECLNFNEKLKKTKSFLSIFRLLRNSSTNMLMELCNKMDAVDAVFSIFPKPQIGSHREILIQSVMLRVTVKFLETIAKEVCKTHEKEMLTKQQMRTIHQSDTNTHYKDLMRVYSKKSLVSVYFSMNMDSSKWSPGFVMENFMYFVNEWDIPDSMKVFMMSVISSFSDKKMIVPLDMMEKWAKTSLDQQEYLAGVEMFKRWALEGSGVVSILSGMGQGMFHFLSSMFHVVMDDYCDYLTDKVMKSQYGVTILDRSLISSDDKTKMKMMIFKRGTMDFDKVLKVYLMLTDMFTRLSNIHINWKKSGLSFVLTEFNSVFSIGKRMCMATIKDLYTANDLPDLTYPEEAVKFMLSNIRRCMEHGSYLTTLSVLCRMAREQLKKYYRISDETIREICLFFKCTEEEIPFQLGFFPITRIFENLIYGPEINMFPMSTQRNRMLNKFYRNLYTAKTDTSKAKNEIPFSGENVGRYYLKLPTHMDKKLRNLKKEFFEEDLQKSTAEIKAEINKNALMVNLPRQSWDSYNLFTTSYFSGMTASYEFQDTMAVHSLVRALQLSGKKGVMMPRTEEEEELEMEIHKLGLERKRMLEASQMTHEVDKRMLELMESQSNYQVDMQHFCSRVVNLQTASLRSGIDMLYSADEIMSVSEEVENSLTVCSKDHSIYHSKFREIRFGKEDVSISSTYKELINYMFDEESDIKNSVVATLNQLLRKPKLQNIFLEKDKGLQRVFENPFGFIKDYMNNSSTSFMDFKNYCTYMFKSLKEITIKMLSPFSCGGNAYENIRRMYMFMGNPAHRLVDPISRGSKLEEMEQEFLSSVTLGRETSLLFDYRDLVRIGNSDSKITRAAKLNQVSRNRNADSKSISYTRVEYNKHTDNRDNSVVHSWTNLNIIIKIREQKSKLTVYAYSSREMDQVEGVELIMSPVVKFLRDSSHSGKEVVHATRRRTSRLFNMEYNISDITFTTYVKDRYVKWVMYLDVNVESHTLFKEKDFNTTTFSLISSNYAVSVDEILNLEVVLPNSDGSFDDADKVRLRWMLEEKLSITDLDKVLIFNRLVKEIQIPYQKEDKDMFQAMADINAEYSKLDVSSMIKKMFNTDSMDVAMDKLDQLVDKTSSGTSEEEAHMEANLIKTELILETEAGTALEEPAAGTKTNIMRMAEILMNQDTAIDDDTLIETSELTSVSSLVQKMVEESFESMVEVDTAKMRKVYLAVQESTGNLDAFHNMLLWQIKDIFDYELSDNMQMYLYNLVLSKKMPMVNIRPITKFREYGRKVRKTFSGDSRFMQLKEPSKAVYDDISLFV